MNSKDIRRAYDRLKWAFDNQTVNYAEKLLQKCREEERGHCGFMDSFNRYHPNAISIGDAARLFAVKRVAKYLNGEPTPEPSTWLHTQPSALMACAMAAEYGEIIRAAWKDENLSELAALDYCDFVKVKTVDKTECV